MKRSNAVLSIMVWSCAVLACSTTCWADMYFQGLGDLPGGSFESQASDLSADGSVVVGTSSSASGAREAFRWTRSTGMTGLGDLAGGGFNSAAMGISRNGQYVVGYGASPSTGYEASRWQDLNGNGIADPGEMIGLGLLPGLSASHATAVTNNGTVVGYAENPGSGPGTQAFIWQDDNMNGQSDPGEMRILPDLPGGGVYNNAIEFSGDNRTIVGHANDGTYPFDAARWVRGAGGNYEPVSLGQVGVAYAASHDGSVIVGRMNTSQGSESFVWTEATGMVPIGDFAGGPVESHLVDVTDDGSVAVGGGWSASGQEALIWDRINGIRSVEDFLEGYGLELSGWTLLGATGISRDGSTIIGYGIDPSGYTEAWVAQVPLPGAALLGAMGLSLSGCLLRRRSPW